MTDSQDTERVTKNTRHTFYGCRQLPWVVETAEQTETRRSLAEGSCTCVHVCKMNKLDREARRQCLGKLDLVRNLQRRGELHY